MGGDDLPAGADAQAVGQQNAEKDEAETGGGRSTGHYDREFEEWGTLMVAGDDVGNAKGDGSEDIDHGRP